MLMDLHVREVFFTDDGWPVVSPERYTGSAEHAFRSVDLAGEWEVIVIEEPPLERQLEVDQVLWGEGELRQNEPAVSVSVTALADGTAEYEGSSLAWSFDAERQQLTVDAGETGNVSLKVFAGHDWENEAETILFTGLDRQGHSVWGKKVSSER